MNYSASQLFLLALFLSPPLFATFKSEESEKMLLFSLIVQMNKNELSIYCLSFVLFAFQQVRLQLSLCRSFYCSDELKVLVPQRLYLNSIEIHFSF